LRLWLLDSVRFSRNRGHDAVHGHNAKQDVARADQVEGGPLPAGMGMIGLALPEIRRLIATLFHHTHPADHVRAWSDRRRRRQHQARRCHHRRRGHSHVPLQY